MTREEFKFIIDTKREYEFNYRGTSYNLTYEGSSIIFGETYMGSLYKDYGDLMNNAKVGNHFLREMIDILE